MTHRQHIAALKKLDFLSGFFTYLILITILTLDKIIVKMVITPETLLTN